MLRKTLALGVCLFMLAGCSTSPSSTQSQAITQTQQSSDNKSATNEFVQQDLLQLAEDGEKETRRQSIAAKITPLEQEMKLLGEKMLGRQQKLSQIQLQESQLTTDLETHNRNVNAFMMKYKIEVACIGAFGASLSDDNEYSKDAKDLATAVAVACGVGALADGEFGKRVVQVVDQLNQADSYAKDLRSQIEAATSQMNAESQQLESEKAEVSKLTSDIQAYQTQLDAI